ncbi:MAG: hypothetical protein KKF50_02225 [Nanoarchaeota archaeon]|nr:hypothetical protein [Nanoarchaeota archaeon]
MSEIIFHLVKLIKRGISPIELINDFDYSSDDVKTASRIIAYIDTCYKNKLKETLLE